MTRGLRLAMAVALALALAGTARAVAAQEDLELKIKAAFLFNFAKFTTWPPAKLGDAGDPLLLCVQGGSAIGAALQDMVRGRSVSGRTIDVLQSPRPEELRRCHIVYLSAADDSRVAQTLDALASHGVLTVHEADAPQPGGVIRFFLNDAGRVRFEVNVRAASREQLALSSKLLEVSQVVNR
jgi:hypothetical protein